MIIMSSTTFKYKLELISKIFDEGVITVFADVLALVTKSFCCSGVC